MARLFTDGGEGGRATATANDGDAPSYNAGTPTNVTTAPNQLLGYGGARHYEASVGGNHRVYDVAGVAGRGYWIGGFFRIGGPVTGQTMLLYLRGTANKTAMLWVNTSEQIEVRTGAEGGGTLLGSASSVLAVNTYYHLDLYAKVVAATTGEVTGWITDMSTGVTTQLGSAVNIDLGTVAMATASYGAIVGSLGTTVRWDDCYLNDSTGSFENTRRGPAYQKLALPTSQNAVGSWLKPGGGATNEHTSVDNVPPVGIAHSLIAGDAEKQLYNIVSPTGVTGDLELNFPAYNTLIPSGSKLRLMQMIARLGANNATMLGNMRIGTNPQEAGDTAVDFYAGAVAGVDPIGYRTRRGALNYLPNVDRTAAFKARLRKLTASTNAAIVDQYGVMLEYELGKSMPPPRRVRSGLYLR